MVLSNTFSTVDEAGPCNRRDAEFRVLNRLNLFQRVPAAQQAYPSYGSMLYQSSATLGCLLRL
jgi:hypothetical protein